MPTADSGYVAQVKYHYQDHDTDHIQQAPPVQNTWYEVFHAYDVRLLVCAISQYNDEEAQKTLEIRWTIDGNVYLTNVVANAGSIYYVRRYFYPSGAGTDGLATDTNPINGHLYTDKRGQDFKVEVRITSAVGTNQTLDCWCVRETLEAT